MVGRAAERLLDGAANLADSAAARWGMSWPSIQDWPEFDDGFGPHGPAGALRANPFGLHEICGNVIEWCLDDGKGVAAAAGEEQNANVRSLRGGSFDCTAAHVRSATRHATTAGRADYDIGLRPVRALEE